jgi:hypothetical protein
MGTKRVGWARIRSLINENANQLQMRHGVVEAITANKTLTVADGGKRFTVGTATAAVTLPTVAAAGAGWSCEFWVNDETAAVTITAPGTDLILGSVITGADGGTLQLQPPTVIGTEVLVFTTSVVKGDHVTLWCDGTNYFINGRSRVVDAITLAAE